jgi:hypothetical protein
LVFVELHEGQGLLLLPQQQFAAFCDVFVVRKVFLEGLLLGRLHLLLLRLLRLGFRLRLLCLLNLFTHVVEYLIYNRPNTNPIYKQNADRGTCINTSNNMV